MIRYVVIEDRGTDQREDLKRLAEHSKVIETDDGFQVTCNPGQTEDVYNNCVAEAMMDILTYESRSGKPIPTDLYDYVAEVCEENNDPMEIDFPYDFGESDRLPMIKGTISIPVAGSGEPLQMDAYITNHHGTLNESAAYIMAQIVL